MQNNGKHSRPDQAYGQQANRPANMGRQAPARPQQPYGQQAYQRPRISSRATPSNLGSNRRKTGTATHTEGRISTSSRPRPTTSTTA